MRCQELSSKDGIMNFFETTHVEYNIHADNHGVRKIYCGNCNAPLFKWQPGDFEIRLVGSNIILETKDFKTGRDIFVKCSPCQYTQWFKLPWRLWDYYERDFIDERD